MDKLKFENKKEQNLLTEILEGNEQALLELFEMYRPLVENSKSLFWIRDYDAQDWNQEALIICYEAVQTYDQSKGKFGAFYKKLLHNRAITLLRYSRAKRRVGDEMAISLEYIQEYENIKMDMICILDHYQYDQNESALSKLSHLELTSFKILMGILTYEEAMHNLDYSLLQLKRAEDRVYHKLKKTFLKA